jgi:hypothetical protein
MAVRMYPGERVFTRMPYWPHSAAKLRASWMTAALEGLYALVGPVSHWSAPGCLRGAKQLTERTSPCWQ